jgi:hypothetical protein
MEDNTLYQKLILKLIEDTKKGKIEWKEDIRELSKLINRDYNTRDEHMRICNYYGEAVESDDYIYRKYFCIDIKNKIKYILYSDEILIIIDINNNSFIKLNYLARKNWSLNELKDIIISTINKKFNDIIKKYIGE